MRLFAAALATLLASSAFGAKETVPVDVGVGPAFYFIGGPAFSKPLSADTWYTGPVFEDQHVHFGLKIDVEAIIDKEMIRRNINRVPKQYRKQAQSMDEFRFRPSIFIPDTLIISPGYKNTGIYGATWRPISLGLPLASGSAGRFDISAGPMLTLAYLHSSAIPSTFFARPGLDLRLEIEAKLSKTFLISFGWSSAFYIPQVLGAFIKVTPVDESIWHMGQAFVMLHFRFPYEVSL